jgi:cation:H+ antiporter
MHYIHDLITSSSWVAVVALIAAFAVLAKSAELFVDSSISIATRFNVPKMIIGIVLVSMGTTAPELTVSLVSSLKGQPEMALGNAIGSVICDDGLALPLCVLTAGGVIAIAPHVLKVSCIYLVIIQIVFCTFVLRDATLDRVEGIILVTIFVVYISQLLYSSRKKNDDTETLDPQHHDHSKDSMIKLSILFMISLAALIFASDIIVSSATTIARGLNIPEFIIAVTMVALGTSVPEIATCITAARRGEGDLAVGNILGADVLNICWVAGASAIANDLTVHPPRQAHLMILSMVIIVSTMLIMLRWGHSLTRRKGLVLLAMYVVYLVASFLFFPPPVVAL